MSPLEERQMSDQLLQCRSKLALASESAAGSDELILELAGALQSLLGAIDAKLKWLNPGKQTENWLSPKLEESIEQARVIIKNRVRP